MSLSNLNTYLVWYMAAEIGHVIAVSLSTMKKLISNLVVLIAITLNTLLQGQAFAANSTEYVAKMNQFGRLTEYQTLAFADYAQEKLGRRLSPTALKALEASVATQNQSMWAEVKRLQDLYTNIFITKTAGKEDRKLLVFHEANLSKAAHRQLLALHDFINLSLKSKNSDLSSKALSLSEGMNAVSRELSTGTDIKVTAAMGISQVMQAGKNTTSSVCSLLMGFCTRRSLSTLMDNLNEGNFLRSKEYTFEGIEKTKQVLTKEKKAVFILIGNHDQPLMDIALGRKVALKLGSDQHITMTRKTVYPIPPPESAGDVVFVVDNDPKANPVQKSVDIVRKNILDTNKSLVSLAVYPEGMLPYTGGQMPMTVKEGAFVIARKLAVQLAAQDIPVYLVQMKSNVIQHLTSVEDIPALVKMEFVEKVPANPIDKGGDAWIEAKRVQAENSFNSHRGESQIDIFNLDKVPSSKIPYGLEMKKCSMVFIL